MQKPLGQNYQPEIHPHPPLRTDMEKFKKNPAVKPNTKHRQTEKEHHAPPAKAHHQEGKNDRGMGF